MTKLALLLLCALLALLVPGAEWIGRTLLAIVEAAFFVWFALFLAFVGLLVGRRAFA